MRGGFPAADLDLVSLPTGPARQFSRARLVAHTRLPLFRNAYTLILSDLSTSGLGLVYWALAARHYPIQEVGLNSLAISTMALLSGLSQLTLMGVLLRFVPRAGPTTARLIGGVYLVGTIGTLLASLLFVSLVDPLATHLFDAGGSTFGLALVAASVTWCIFTLQDNALSGLRATTWIPIENLVYALAKIVLLIVFVTSFADYGIFASWIVPAALLNLPVNAFIFGWLVPRHARSTSADPTALELPRLVRYVAGDSLGSLFTLLPSALLPMIVTHVAGTAANAFYYLPWMVAYSLHLVSFNLGTSLTVEGATDQARLAQYSRRMLWHMFRLVGPMAILLALGSPLILRAFGEDYAREAALLLPLLAIASIPNLINIEAIAIARVQGRTGVIAGLRGALALGVLGLSLVLVPPLGITGVGVAMLLCNLLVALLLGLPVVYPVIRAPATPERM